MKLSQLLDKCHDEKKLIRLIQKYVPYEPCAQAMEVMHGVGFLDHQDEFTPTLIAHRLSQCGYTKETIMKDVSMIRLIQNSLENEQILVTIQVGGRILTTVIRK